MAHYAKVLDGKVVDVIVAEAEFFDTFVDTEPGNWIQTSYNTYGNQHYGYDSNGNYVVDGGTPLRGNFAGVGYTYDSTHDAFYTEKPDASWTLNTSTFLWDPPFAAPDDGKKYYWDESLYQSDNTKGWVEITK